MSSWKRLEIERIQHEDPKAVVYRLEGVLTDTKDCFGLLEMLRKDVKGGGSRVVIHLGKIEHITSAGVGILAACYLSANNAKSRLSISGASQQARSILQIVKLWDILDHYETEEEALAGRTGS